MTKKELEAKVAELEKEVQMANRYNDGYSDICKGYIELVDTLKSKLTDALDENKKLKETKKESVEEVKPEPKFKVGDRVKCVRSVDRNTNVVDKIGTVVDIIPYEGSFKYGIGFDEKIGGHSCNGRCEDNRGWYCYETALEPAFKVGDRVEVDGDKGTIVGFDKDNWPGVAFDDPRVGLHDCYGLCEYGRGLWCIPKTVKPLKEEPKKPEPAFKVGDRVKCVTHGLKPFGLVGTVRYVNNDSTPYAVEFDRYIDGHEFNGTLRSKGIECKEGCGWWVAEGDLELVKPEPKFKVGDRVKCVTHWYKTYLIGEIGTIKKLLKGGLYVYTVDFDKYIGGHNGGGTCKPGHGSQIREDCLELVKEEPKPEPKFKVGDRVKCVKVADGNERALNKIGTVKHVDTDSRLYAVEFDEDINGHRLRTVGINCECGHGWWCSEDELELVKEEPEHKFKVGDRVKVLSGTGTIKGVRTDGTFAIEFYRSLGFVGHTCGGLCEDRHGLWVHEDLIKLIDENAELKNNVLNAMRICSDDYLNCGCCPYHGREEGCLVALYKDALKLLED